MLGRRRGPDAGAPACTAAAALAATLAAGAITPSATWRESDCANAATGTVIAIIVKISRFMGILRMRGCC
jgi:hypothetical protein